MRAQSIGLAELTTADVERWRELAARAVEPNPFHEPEYVLPLARELGQLEAVQMIVVADAGDWLACLPVHAGRWHRIPLASLSTWRGHPLYGLLGTPLVDAERAGETLDELVRSLLAGRRIRFAALEWVTEDRGLAPVLGEVLGQLRPRPLCFERFQRAALRRRAEPTYLDEALGRRRRKELRRRRRKLAEALDGEPEVVDRAGEAAACDELIALEAAGRKRLRGTVLAADAAHARFFRQICRQFAECGRLQLPSLRVGDQTVATQCNLVAGDTIFSFKIAYDERWAALSPGILLDVEMVGLFHEQATASLIDSCADPNNATINGLWPDRRSLATHVLRPPGAAGRAAAVALHAARALRDGRASLKRRRRP